MSSGDTGTGAEGGTSAGNGRSTAPRLEVTGTQVCASALASVSGATVASFFGVAGTVVGAATMSVVATVGGAVYSFWLRRTHARLQEAPITTRVVDLMSGGVGERTTREVERAGEVPTEVDATQVGATEDTAVADVSHVEANDTADVAVTQLASGQDEDRKADSPWAWVSQRRWGVAAGVAVVFAVSLGFVTLVELVGQRPLSSIAGGESSAGTSIGTLVDGDDDSSSPDATTTTTTTDASTDTSQPDASEDSSEPEPSSEDSETTASTTSTTDDTSSTSTPTESTTSMSTTVATPSTTATTAAP